MGKKAADGEKGGKKKMIMIVVGVAVLGVGAKMTVLKPKAEAAETAKVEPAEGEIVDVGSLTVNLADVDRHYARVGIGLVLNATASAEEVGKKVPLFKDAAIAAINKHTSAELRTTEGREALRKELMEATHGVWHEEEGAATKADPTVLKIALTELLVQ